MRLTSVAIDLALTEHINRSGAFGVCGEVEGMGLVNKPDQQVREYLLVRQHVQNGADRCTAFPLQEIDQRHAIG